MVGPEQGITLPGLLMVCGDSHTSTHGALGCIAFGIGASEVAHVLATQSLWQRKPKTLRINVNGALGFGVTGKDVILAIIRAIGAAVCRAGRLYGKMRSASDRGRKLHENKIVRIMSLQGRHVHGAIVRANSL